MQRSICSLSSTSDVRVRVGEEIWYGPTLSSMYSKIDRRPLSSHTQEMSEREMALHCDHFKVTQWTFKFTYTGESAESESSLFPACPHTCMECNILNRPDKYTDYLHIFKTHKTKERFKK